MNSTYSKKAILITVIEWIFRLFVSALFIIWGASVVWSIGSDTVQGRIKGDIDGESIGFFLAGMFCLCIGISIGLPMFFGARLSKLLSKVFAPIVKLKNFLKKTTNNYKLKEMFVHLLNNNRFFQSLYFFLCSVFFFILASFGRQDSGIVLQIAGYIIYAASSVSFVMSLYLLFPRTLIFLGKSLLLFLSAILAILTIYFLYLFLEGIVGAVAGLPVSAAIIIGAIIIALAVSGKK